MLHSSFTLLVYLGCNKPEPMFEIAGTSIQIKHSQPEHVTRAKSVLLKLAGTGECDQLVESVFRSKYDWIYCEVFQFDKYPNLELVSLHQNKIDGESASKAPSECKVTQLFVDRTTLRVVDMKIETGYSHLVHALDGSWVVELATPIQ